MLHLREYYERALREFGSTDSGKGFLSFQFSAASFISVCLNKNSCLFCPCDYCHAEWSLILLCP